MAIKNLQVNGKMGQKIASLAIAGSILAASLTGCGSSKKSFLNKTSLEKTSVVTFCDGSKDLVNTLKNPCRDSLEYNHYVSLISGNYYSDMECKHVQVDGEVNHHYDILSVENITKYLTDDEITKAINDELTDEDVKIIIERITEPQEVKSK